MNFASLMRFHVLIYAKLCCYPVSIASIEYKGLLTIPDSYRPPYSCREHILQDFPGALPGVRQLAFILEESQRIATDRLSRLPVEALRLTEDEALAVASYTFDLGIGSDREGEDNLYNQLNNCLRERNAQTLDLLKPYLSYLFGALAKFPVIKTRVYRGIPAASLGIVLEKYKPGTRVHWGALISTSTNISTAKQFALGPGGTIFRLNILNGRRCSLYSYSMSEDEVLLSPNSVFVVTAECRQDEDGYVLVDMVEIRGEGYVF